MSFCRPRSRCSQRANLKRSLDNDSVQAVKVFDVITHDLNDRVVACDALR